MSGNHEEIARQELDRTSSIGDLTPPHISLAQQEALIKSGANPKEVIRAALIQGCIQAITPEEMSVTKQELVGMYGCTPRVVDGIHARLTRDVNLALKECGLTDELKAPEAWKVIQLFCSRPNPVEQPVALGEMITEKNVTLGQLTDLYHKVQATVLKEQDVSEFVAKRIYELSTAPTRDPNSHKAPVMPAVGPIKSVKRYHDDPVKEKSRAMLRSMIEEEILSVMKPDKVQVLCLPGVDLQEIISVYDALGIPRGNITAFERDPEIAKIIRAQAPELRLHESGVEEHFKQQSQGFRFDVISLDYTGTFSVDQARLVRILARGNAARKYILHQANSARRDRHSYELYASAQGYYGSPSQEVLHPIDSLRRILKNTITQESMLLEARDRNESIKEIRSNAFSDCLLQSIDNPFSSADILKILCFFGKDDGEQFIETMLPGAICAEGQEPIRPGDSDLQSFTLPYAYWMTAAEGELTDRLLAGNPNTDPSALGITRVARMVSVTGKAAYRTCRLQRYAYVSTDATPMIGDILTVERDDRALRALQSIASRMKNAHRSGSRFYVDDQIFDAARFGHEIGLIRKQVREQSRTFLGSSARPLLTKKKALQELAHGASVDEIHAKYRGTDNKPFAQWKAHLTMGTYDYNEEPAGSHIEEEFSKSDALALLNENIPIEEIVEAYPGVYTLAQLRAFKAHITMGTYGK